MTVCVKSESLLGSLMSGNCLNLSGCGTGPRANCSAKGGKIGPSSTFLLCFFYSNSV